MRLTRVNLKLSSHVSIDVASGRRGGESSQKQVEVVLKLLRATMELALAQYFHCRVTRTQKLATRTEIQYIKCAECLLIGVMNMSKCPSGTLNDRNPTVITPLWGKCFVYCSASCYGKAPAPAPALSLAESERKTQIGNLRYFGLCILFQNFIY